MSVAFEDGHDVWAYCDNPEWLKQAAGYPDMRLTTGQSLASARLTAERMATLLVPGGTFEVRNIYGDTIATYGPVRARLSGPQVQAPYVPRRRRALGNRGA